MTVKSRLDYRVVHVLSKELRARAFAIFRKRVASPREVSDELGEGLSQVAYHIDVLLSCGLIVLDHTAHRGGAVEHFYRATTPALIPWTMWHRLPAVARSGPSMHILREFFEDASDSVRAERFGWSPGEPGWAPGRHRR